MLEKIQHKLDKPGHYRILERLPQWTTWFLGYRKKPEKPVNALAREICHFLITFTALIINLSIAKFSPLTTHKWNIDTLIPSFGATCVLLFGVPHAPYSQPRNVVWGHFISAIIGVGMARLFMHIENYEKYMWISGSLSVACAIFFMEATGTIHPPAGATALITSTNAQFRSLSWDYLPLLLIHTVVFLAVALLFHNLYTYYPVYWISPDPKGEVETAKDPESAEIIIRKNETIIPNGIVLLKDEFNVIYEIQRRL